MSSDSEWRAYVSGLLGVEITEENVKEVAKGRPAETSPPAFTWLYVDTDTFDQLLDRVEVMTGDELVPILRNVNVNQSSENLAYKAPELILRWFGLLLY